MEEEDEAEDEVEDEAAEVEDTEEEEEEATEEEEEVVSTDFQFNTSQLLRVGSLSQLAADGLHVAIPELGPVLSSACACPRRRGRLVQRRRRWVVRF